jgi:hypothetical protein
LGKGFHACSNEGNCPSSMGDNSKRVKIQWFFLIFSRTSRTNSIKLITHYPWIKGIQVCSNKGPGPFLRGQNHKNVKMVWGHLKIFFPRTTWPILTRLGINDPWGKGIKFCSNEGDCPSPMGDNGKRVEIQWIEFLFKNSSSSEPAEQIQ